MKEREKKLWLKWYPQQARADLGLAQLAVGHDCTYCWYWVRVLGLACESECYLRSGDEDHLIGGLYSGRSADGESPIPATEADVAEYLGITVPAFRRFFDRVSRVMPGRFILSEVTGFSQVFQTFNIVNYQKLQRPHPSDLPGKVRDRVQKYRQSRSESPDVTTMKRPRNDPPPTPCNDLVTSQRREERGNKPPIVPQAGDGRSSVKTSGKPCPWCSNPTDPDNDDLPEPQRLMQLYHDAYRARPEGSCPVIGRNSKEWGALTRLMELAGSFARARDVIRHGVLSEDRFVVDGGHTLAVIVMKYQGIAQALDAGRVHGAAGKPRPTSTVRGPAETTAYLESIGRETGEEHKRPPPAKPTPATG